MAMDVPVVSTIVGMAPDVIDHGTSGFLAEPEDSEGLARAILKIAGGAVDKGRLTTTARRAVAVCGADAVGNLHWREIVEPYLRGYGAFHHNPAQ
jgi:glycosyltransferase involved in cell wall biosynthesis